METIKNIIIQGLLKDIQIARRAFLLNKYINISYKSIQKKQVKDISMILYDLSYTEMVLSLARVYDEAPRNYPTLSLKALYDALKKTKNIQSPTEDGRLNLHTFGFHSEDMKLLKGSSDQEFNQRCIWLFEARETNHPLIEKIERLKLIRDKVLAHNEGNKINSLVLYEDIESLLEHAENVCNFFSVVYGGIHINHLFEPGGLTTRWERVYSKFIRDHSAD